jgi:hypothetical protein
MKLLRTIVTIALALGLAGTGFAQDAQTSSGDDPFNTEESVVETTGETQNAAPTTEFLKTEGTRITGSITAQVGVSGTWDTVWTGAFDPFAAQSYALTPQVGVNIGFSAKPDTDLGFYGEIRTSYPFLTAAQFFMLYTKFNWNDVIFFVFGKQPVRWGTGYFFTPADDILSLTQVNLDDPTAEREGPVALKTQLPIPGTLSNLYLFTIFPSATMKPEDIAVAPKVELQFGNTELAVAGYYQKDQKPQAIAMASTGTGEINVFGEAVVSFGSDRTFIVKRDIPVTVKAGPLSIDFKYKTEKIADYAPVISATVGGIYRNTDWNMNVIAQYLFNGSGYADLNVNDIVAAFMERANPFYPDPDDPIPTAADLTLGGRIGRHYLIASVSWAEIFSTKLAFSIMGYSNLSDLSGQVKPTVSFALFNRMTLSVSAGFSFGADGSELVDPAGLAKKIPGSPSYDPGYTAAPTMSLSANLTLGSGVF